MRRTIQQVAFELSICWQIDADMGVPIGMGFSLSCYATLAIADRVALELNWGSSAISDLLSLLLLEWVMSIEFSSFLIRHKKGVTNS